MINIFLFIFGSHLKTPSKWGARTPIGISRNLYQLFLYPISISFPSPGTCYMRYSMEGGCEKSVKRTQETPQMVFYSLLGWGIFLK
jgi:hypothetical protein